MTDSHTKTAIVATADTLDRARGLNPLVQRMADRLDQLDPAAMREMLALQREWEAGEARRAYNSALVELHRALPRVIGHDKDVSFDQGKTVAYSHATMAKVAGEVVPVLHDHGFTHSFRTTTDQRGVVVTVRITHRDGHFEESELAGPPDKSGSKSGAQAAVSTVTLLKRHCLLAMLGIETKDMRESPGRAEPKESELASIDPSRTANALRWLQAQGVDRAQAETFIGRGFKKWTRGDLAKLKPWVAELEAPADDEPVDAEFEEADEWGPNTGPDEVDR